MIMNDKIISTVSGEDRKKIFEVVKPLDNEIVIDMWFDSSDNVTPWHCVTYNIDTKKMILYMLTKNMDGGIFRRM